MSSSTINNSGSSSSSSSSSSNNGGGENLSKTESGVHPGKGKGVVVLVQGFKSGTTAQHLHQLFVRALYVNIAVHFASLEARDSAFVTFANAEEAQRAVEWYDGALLDGSRLFVRLAMPHKRVVVVGAGLAGMTAALSAAEAGASVRLLEAEPRVGGNSAKASSGMNAVPTPAQEQAGENDTLAEFTEDTLASGKDKSDKKLVKAMAQDSLKAYKFLEGYGVDLSKVSRCGGHSHARTHRSQEGEKPVNIGWSIVSSLKAVVEAHERIELMTGAHVKALMQEQGVVTGVEVTMQLGVTDSDDTRAELCLPADAVVVATGGYSQNKTMLQASRPDLVDMPSTNGPFAQGKGVQLCTEAGGMAVQMDCVQLHPTGFVDPANPSSSSKFLAPEALRASGAILVNEQGAAFVDPLEKRDAVSAAILEHCAVHEGANAHVAYMIMDDGVVERFGAKVFGFYAHVKKLISSHEGVEALAQAIGCDASALQGAMEGSQLDASASTLYLAMVTPSVHYTMGGVAINAQAQVLSEAYMVPIPGLFAAGEVTGGLHGANRLAGNSLLECVVFGRRAGRFAATTESRQPALSPQQWTPLRFRELEKVSPTTSIFRFDLPSAQQQSGLQLGQYIAVQANLGGEDVVRYYSPFSRPDDYGVLELLVKITADGTMTEHLNSLKPGDTLNFKGPIDGLALEVGSKKRIGMLAGGTGIAPMLQLIRAHLLHERKVGANDECVFDMTLVYGAKDETELVMREAIERHQSKHPCLKTYYVLENTPEEWTQGKGFITKDIIQAQLPEPAEDSFVVVCGPPVFCRIMKGALNDLGYREGEHYFSFL